MPPTSPLSTRRARPVHGWGRAIPVARLRPRITMTAPLEWRAPSKETARMLVFRQLFDPTSSTYTYLLGDSASGEAVLIHPVVEPMPPDPALIVQLRIELPWELC